MRAKQIKIRKEVSVLYIHPKSVDEYWNLCEFNLREGLKYDGDPMSLAELKKRIKSWHISIIYDVWFRRWREV